MIEIITMTATLTGTFVLGAALWTFTEYAMHAWNGHWMKGKTKFSRLHLKHHADTKFFAPTVYKFAAAIPVIGVAGLVSLYTVGPLFGFAFTAGFAATYTAYEVLHRRTHTHPPMGPYGRWARKSHLSHHFHNPNGNHGVTTPIWDFVFGTYKHPDVVRVPERHAMLWLIDPATNEVYERYAQDYVLAKRRRATPKAVSETETKDMDAAYAGVAPAF